MQVMQVEGLTRENVASHLQKYRLPLRKAAAANSGGETGDGSGSPPGGIAAGTAAPAVRAPGRALEPVARRKTRLRARAAVV